MEQLDPRWRKSSHSGNGGISCLEAGRVPGAVVVRDTTQRGRGPVVRVTPRDWKRLIASLKP
jgi:hypothetical protein